MTNSYSSLLEEVSSTEYDFSIFSWSRMNVVYEIQELFVVEDSDDSFLSHCFFHPRNKKVNGFIF